MFWNFKIILDWRQCYVIFDEGFKPPMSTHYLLHDKWPNLCKWQYSLLKFTLLINNLYVKSKVSFKYVLVVVSFNYYLIENTIIYLRTVVLIYKIQRKNYYRRGRWNKTYLAYIQKWKGLFFITIIIYYLLFITY